MCAGPDYSGTFDQCRFDECTLYAVHGACLSVSRCHFRRSAPAVIATGGSTLTRFFACLFQACPAAVIIDAGATVFLHSSCITGARTGLIVKDPGSHAELEDTILHCDKGAALSERGVSAWGGATARLRNSSLSGVVLGVRAAGRGTAVELKRSSIEEYECAVDISGGGKCSLAGVDMCEQRVASKHEVKFDVDTDCAVRLSQSDSTPVRMHVQMHGCTVLSTAGKGVRLGALCRADVLLCGLRSRDGGVHAEGESGRAHVRHCEVDTCKFGFWASSPGCVLCVTGCRVDSIGGACVGVSKGTAAIIDSALNGRRSDTATGVVNAAEGATLTMVRCNVSDGVTGVRAAQSSVWMVDTVISGMRRRVGGIIGPSDMPILGAACVFESCVATVCGGTVRDCAFGVSALRSLLAGTSDVRVDGLRIDACAQGVLVVARATVAVTNCTFVDVDVRQVEALAEEAGLQDPTNSLPTAVLYVRGDSLSVSDCTFTGRWNVVDMGGETPMQISRCVFSSSAAIGERRTFVSVSGEAVVDGCEFSNASSAVAVDLGISVTVRKCRFGPEVSVGVFVDEGAAAEVEDCTFDSCEQAVFAHAGSAVALRDCVCKNSHEGIRAEDVRSLTATRLTVRSGGTGVMVACLSGKPAAVTLVDCRVFASSGVILGHVGVTASILRCEIAGDDMGVVLLGSCVLTMRHSSVRRFQCGVLVGYATDEMIDPGCPVCGFGGPAAQQAAYTALLKWQGRQPEGARCTHEGAVARATLENVDVRGCTDTGVMVNVGGHMVAEQLRVANSFLRVLRVGEKSRFEDCSVTRPWDFGSAWHKQPHHAFTDEHLPGVGALTCGHTCGPRWP